MAAVLERDVVQRIRLLELTCKKLSDVGKDQPAFDKIANDLFMPIVKNLAAFCESMEIAFEKENALDSTWIDQLKRDQDAKNETEK